MAESLKVPLIAEVKRNSLDDGPGVRSTVFVKGCPLSCVWCHNPECLSAAVQLWFHQDRCIGAHDCVPSCPPRAIAGEGPKSLDWSRCDACGLCEQACPAAALEVVGRRWDLSALVEHLLLDERLYQNSGGGVTLSGGEATLYADWMGALGAALKHRGVRVLLETCGHFDWDRFASAMLPSLDEVFLDLKLMDPLAHRVCCGRDNATILANAERLLATALPVSFRVPLIPGLTDTRANLGAVAAWLTGRGVRRVTLLPYNPLWAAKSRELGMPVRFFRQGFMTADEKRAAREALPGLGIVGGD